MTTTIQISDTTKQILGWIKEKENADSYDQVIQHLVKIHAHVPNSMFGSIKGLSWKKRDRMKFHDEIHH